MASQMMHVIKRRSAFFNHAVEGLSKAQRAVIELILAPQSSTEILGARHSQNASLDLQHVLPLA